MYGITLRPDQDVVQRKVAPGVARIEAKFILGDRASVEEPTAADPAHAGHEDPTRPTSTKDWAAALLPSGEIGQRTVGAGVIVRVIPVEFELWQGPRLTMAEDCNKKGGRVVGDLGEMSCAEVEIVKRLRAAGWAAAWVQSWKCGRRSWGSFIADLPDLPEVVRSIQRIAGEAGGHPDVIAWSDDRVVALESKGPTDALKQSQIDWFSRSIQAGIGSGDIGVVEWRVRLSVSF